MKKRLTQPDKQLISRSGWSSPFNKWDENLIRKSATNVGWQANKLAHDAIFLWNITSSLVTKLSFMC